MGSEPLYNVMVAIPGATYPDEWIIRGNHHDAWVNGANDPVSGASAELEEMRGLAMLLKQGWKPRRTIIYAFWDGEEEGLLGSTEWAEQHAAELSQKAAVYINSDSNSRGSPVRRIAQKCGIGPICAWTRSDRVQTTPLSSITSPWPLSTSASEAK